MSSFQMLRWHEGSHFGNRESPRLSRYTFSPFCFSRLEIELKVQVLTFCRIGFFEFGDRVRFGSTTSLYRMHRAELLPMVDRMDGTSHERECVVLGFFFLHLCCFMSLRIRSMFHIMHFLERLAYYHWQAWRERERER